uniref:Uncharacterized protein n=1 Tax=Rhodnius prolixus TaxID=13249 RepID=T1HFB2_RHOPR
MVNCMKFRMRLHVKLPFVLVSVSTLVGVVVLSIKSVRDLLASKVTTYDIELGGIILSYKNVKINSSVEMNDEEHFILDYVADVYLFTPQIGSTLTGRINKKGRDVLGCLVHSIFNVALPRPRSEEDSPKKWLGSKVFIGQKVTFSVVKLDFTGRLPYIRGELLSLESSNEADDEGADSGMGYQESIEEDCFKKESNQCNVPDTESTLKRRRNVSDNSESESFVAKKKFKLNSSDEGLSGEESVCPDPSTNKLEIVGDLGEGNISSKDNHTSRKKKKKNRHSSEIETCEEIKDDRKLSERELKGSLKISSDPDLLENERLKKEKKKKKSENSISRSSESISVNEDIICVREKKKRKKSNQISNLEEISNKLLNSALENSAVKIENIKEEHQTSSTYEQVESGSKEEFNLESVKSRLLQQTLCNFQNGHERKSVKRVIQTTDKSVLENVKKKKLHCTK